MRETDALLLERLKRPEGKIDVALDTDTYNEIDDQFALAYLLSSPEKMNVKAIYAAPFHNEKSDGPADGMEKSFQEIHRILGLMGREELKERVFRGSRSYLADETQPVLSPAAEHLAGLAMQYTPQKPLYVAALGAITNVASAMLLQPEIRDRIVLVWLGGNAHWWPDNREFNLMQDVAAARVVFGSGAALVQLPLYGRGIRIRRLRGGAGTVPSRKKRGLRLSDGACRAGGRGRQPLPVLDQDDLGRDGDRLAGKRRLHERRADGRADSSVRSSLQLQSGKSPDPLCLSY